MKRSIYSVSNIFFILHRQFLIILYCIKKSIIDLIKHDGIEHAGYIAFITMLGIFPLVIIFVSVIGLIGKLYFHNELSNIFQVILLESKWSELITSLKPRFIEIIKTPPQKFLTFAIVTAIWSASSIIEGFRTILNRAYRVPTQLPYIFGRFFSILQFVLLLVIMSLLVVILNIIPLIMNYLNEYLSYSTFSSTIYYRIYRFLESTVLLRDIITLSIGFIFVLYLHYSLPNKKQHISHLLLGVCITIIGWFVCYLILQYYISSFSQINFIYGSIAGVIISLFYFYMCNLVFIFSAEFNYNYYKHRLGLADMY